MSATESKKIGILVVAYNAATTLAEVLDRIPVEIHSAIQEVIVSDDHSQDSTYLVGLRIPTDLRPADHLDQAADQFGVWRESEGRIRPGNRARTGHRRHAAR